MSKPFPIFLNQTRQKQEGWKPYPIVVAFDPGETTGYCVFIEGVLHVAGQLNTETVKLGVPVIQKTLQTYKQFNDIPAMVVFEDYRIYSWKTDQHTWAALHTPQMLGVIEALCYVEGLETRRQMAQQPKQFCTDDKLKLWGYYRKGERHARDAIRHATYYLLFNDQKIKKT